MCVGVPMRVIETGVSEALCEADGERRRVSVLLLDGPPPVGSHVLVHGTAAIRTLDAQEARLVADALRAVLAAAEGAPFEHLIADLVDREPELPPHLRPPAGGHP